MARVEISVERQMTTANKNQNISLLYFKSQFVVYRNILLAASKVGLGVD